jgi:hypothetical protein
MIFAQATLALDSERRSFHVMDRLPPDVLALLKKAALSENSEAAINLLLARLKTLPDWEQLQEVLIRDALRRKVEEAKVTGMTRGTE